MINKKLLLFFCFFFLNTKNALSCDWCNAYAKNKAYTYEAFFIKLYFEKCQPSARQLIDFFKTMCVNACINSLKKMINLLGNHPNQYFHLPKKKLGGKELVDAVNTYDQLLLFIHNHVIDPQTKMLIPYQHRSKNANQIFLSTYLKEYAEPDEFGCTVLDDLHAQSLSYAGALFNSYLLKNTIEISDQRELIQLTYLFSSIQYLGSQLRNSPYQQNAEKAVNNWTRLFSTIEKEQKQRLKKKK